MPDRTGAGRNWGIVNKPVKLSDIIDAIEMMTDESSSYLNMILLISGMNTRVRH